MPHRRWRWGESDCLLVPADWIAAETGIDPAAAYRGAYDDEIGCRRVLRARGGVVQLVARAMRAAGFAPVADAAPGDVGLVRAPVRGGKHAAIGAVCAAPNLWAVFTSDCGLVVADLSVVRAWRIP